MLLQGMTRGTQGGFLSKLNWCSSNIFMQCGSAVPLFRRLPLDLVLFVLGFCSLITDGFGSISVWNGAFLKQ